MASTFLNFFRDSWWVWIFLGVAALWGTSLVLMRRWARQSLLAALVREEIRPEELEINLPDPRPEDETALGLLRDHRRRYLLKLWPDTQFSFTALNDLSQALVREIAGIYHPEEERPELKASLADLVTLYRRVGVRLGAWMETLPFRPLKDVDLSTVLFLHDAYQKVKEHPVYQFLRRHHLYRVANWAWAAKNLVNPWYWGRRAAYTGSREVLSRLFLAKVVTVVGEEAIRLYSRRSPNLRIVRRYQVGVQELLNLALEENGDLPGEAAAYILKLILKARDLEDQEKVALLKKLARPRQQKNDLGNLEPPDKDAIKGWLKGLVKACWTGPEQQDRLRAVRERWKDVGGGPGT